MKKCTYCGRENEDSAVHCSGCGLEEFKIGSPAEAEAGNILEELVTLITCATLTEADLIATRLNSAGIETFIPDEQLMQTVGFNLNAYGYVRLQVRRMDYANARELLAQAEAAEVADQAGPPGGRKIIASLEIGQTGEILDRLKKAGIPVQMQTVTEESGLETSEISVEESYYERACGVVEAWDDERTAREKKRSRVYCGKCGSRDYDETGDEETGHIYKCKNCGELSCGLEK